MLNRFRNIVEDMRGLIDDSRSASAVMSGRCLLAVSGGMDSMCLADLWMRAFGPESFAVAHCNFGLRGEESDGDEALVTRWAEDRGVVLHKVSFDTGNYASEEGISIEMAARELRYRWFGELCRQHGYMAVAVAHHADDNAETMVLNMVRGAGLKGLSGMKPVSDLPYAIEMPGHAGHDVICDDRHPRRDEICDDRHPRRDEICDDRHPRRDEICDDRHPRLDRGTLIRPLLTFTRKQIEGHVMANRVPYRNDSTNSSVVYRRNSIRHEVFPLFSKMNPSYVRTLNREMTYIGEAAQIVEQWCQIKMHEVICSTDPLTISVSALLSVPQWRYLLFHILEPYGFNASVLESLENLLVSDRTMSGKCFEAMDHVLRTERGTLVVLRREEACLDDPIIAYAPSIYTVNGVGIRVEEVCWDSDMPLRQPKGTLILDASRFRFPFIFRGWHAGDWMIPLGMKGQKKVSDIFTDLKYDALKKASAIVAFRPADSVSGGYQRVAAILGERVDDSFKVWPSTRMVIRITLI